MATGHTQINDVLDELSTHVQENPFQYPNETPVVDEIYHRFRNALNTVYLPVDFSTDYGDESKWKVSEAAESVKGKVARLRTEVSFVVDREPFSLNSGNSKRFDLALFADDPPLHMQSKRPGPGDHWDVDNDLTMLCEVKHSRNMTNRLYADKYGARDVEALSEYPGSVDHRIFLFVDWWPKNKNGDEQLTKRIDKLRKNVSDLDHSVTVVYIPRCGEVHHEALGG